MENANVDARITPALHPDNVKQIEGYDDQIAQLLGPTLTAFSTAYEGIKAVWDAKKAASTNPTWNEAQQIIQTSDYAEKHLARITKGFDNVLATLTKQIEHFESELATPLEARAGASMSVEIRKYVHDMPVEKRHQFLQRAIEEGDHITASAVLGAPPYLSGLDANFKKTYLRMWNERATPETARRLKAVQAAKQMVEERAGLVFKELERAVGAPPHKVKALREAKTAAEKAFVLKDLGQ